MKYCQICSEPTSTQFCRYACQEDFWALQHLEGKHETELTKQDQERLDEIGKRIELGLLLRGAM